jgi:hypothetical protein
VLTLVLSGPVTARSQTEQALRQQGVTVEDGNDPHGWDGTDPAVGFITAHDPDDGDVDRAVVAVEPFGWALRSHWSRTGDWQKVPGVGSPVAVPDPLDELEKLKSRLRAAGIDLGEGA